MWKYFWRFRTGATVKPGRWQRLWSSKRRGLIAAVPVRKPENSFNSNYTGKAFDLCRIFSILLWLIFKISNDFLGYSHWYTCSVESFPLLAISWVSVLAIFADCTGRNFNIFFKFSHSLSCILTTLYVVPNESWLNGKSHSHSCKMFCSNKSRKTIWEWNECKSTFSVSIFM